MTGQNKKQNKVQSKSNVRNAADGIFERSSGNVLGLYVVGDLTHKSSIELQKFNKSTKV
jgi:hypothetical protein